MKTIYNSARGDSKTNISLKKLVDDIIQKSSATINGNRISIQNNISTEIYLHSGEDIVATVTAGMLDAMLTNAADGDIDISAKEIFSNTIKLCVRDNNCYNTYAVACSLQNLVPLTERVGGYLNITNQRQKITTIEFSFPDPGHEGHQESDE